MQCVASLLSTMAGIGAVLAPLPSLSSSSPGTYSSKLPLLRRCLLCALAKHASGLLAAAALSASRVPRSGLRSARRTIESLALDPVSQYLFYCSLLLVWAPSSPRRGGGGGTGAAAAKAAAGAAGAVPWWLSGGGGAGAYVTPCLLGPVLLREAVSTAWVISDVSILLSTSSSGREAAPVRIVRSAFDAVMSLLFTPRRWTGSTSYAERQRLLAALVSRTSLLLEAMTGIVLLYDAFRAFLDYALSPVEGRPNLLGVVKRVACARLYVNFMLVRRKKVRDLVGTIRGGARHVPGRVLDVLLEPMAAMGLDGKKTATETPMTRDGTKEPMWLNDFATALGL